VHLNEQALENAEEEEEDLRFDAESTEIVDVILIFDERAVRGMYRVIVRIVKIKYECLFLIIVSC